MEEKIIIGVIVHDRMDNLIEWIRCFKQCNSENAELVIIHNYKEGEQQKYQEYCQKNNILCITRSNIGYDIGAFQDVCRERLEGFPNDWNYLLWVTDDTIIMKKNFINAYLELMTPDVGVACLEISEEIQRHIRTSGFIISKEISLSLQFPNDPIIKHDDCFEFEHRNDKTFYKQVINLNKKVVQVTDVSIGHLWDINHRAYFKRWDEHYQEFPKI